MLAIVNTATADDRLRSLSFSTLPVQQSFKNLGRVFAFLSFLANYGIDGGADS